MADDEELAILDIDIAPLVSSYSIQDTNDHSYSESVDKDRIMASEDKAFVDRPCYFIPAWTNKQFFIVFMLGVAYAFARTVVFVQLRITPIYAKSLTEHGVATGRLDSVPLACMFYGGTFAAPIAARVLAKIGRKKGFVYGCLIGIFGAMLAVGSTILQAEIPSQDSNTSFGFSFSLLCLGTLMLGFTNGFINMIRFAAAEIVDENKNYAISGVLFAADAAALVGPPIADWTYNFDFLWAYGGSYISLIFLLAFCMATIVFIPLPPPPAPIDLEKLEPPRPFRELIRTPRLVLALITATIGFGMMSLLMVLIPLVMDGVFADHQITTVLQVHSIGMFTPGLIVGWLNGVKGPLPVAFCGLIILCVSNVIMAVGDMYWNFLLGMVLLGIGWNFTFISSTILLTQTYLPSEKATIQGWNDFSMYLIVSTLTLFSASLLDLVGTWSWLNVVSFIICVFGCFAIMFVVALELFQRRAQMV